MEKMVTNGRLRMRVLIFSCLIFCGITVLRPVAAGAFSIARNGTAMCYIMLAQDASPTERYAADELASHIAAMTGAAIPVRQYHADGLPPTGNALLIGTGPWLDAERFADVRSELSFAGDQGYVIRSFPDFASDALVVAGNTPRGTLYGVYGLLRMAGIRWYTPDVTYYPPRRTVDLSEVNVTDMPCFQYRGVQSAADDAKPVWFTRQRLNIGQDLPVRQGQPPVYVPVELTADDLIPVARYAQEPGLFALVDGTRTAQTSSRCFSNPAAAPAAADSIIARRARSGTSFVSITLDMAAFSDCDCPVCRAARVRNGGVSVAPVLEWVNEVSRICRRRGVAVSIELVAGGTLEIPPSETEPAEGVAIRLLADSVNRATFIERAIDTPTMQFMEHLRGWRSLTDHMLISHPCGNERYPAAIMPDYTAMFLDVNLYHYELLEGVTLTMPRSPGMYLPDPELRTWVMSELMWDRYRDGAVLVREWMRRVYGSASGPMMDYWQHVQKIAERADNIRGNAHPGEYVTPEWLDEGARMLQRAKAATLSDPIAARRVSRARIGHMYLRLMVDELDPDGRNGMLDEFVAACREHGYDRVSPDVTIEEFAAAIRNGASTQSP